MWYPAAGPASATERADAPAASSGGPFPLVVWAHGFNRVSVEYRSLLQRWASAGYVIVAPNLPSLRRPAPGQGPASEADERSEPGDLSFVASQVTAISAHPGGPLSGLVDAHHLIAAGHSDGAVDALAMGLASCCRDRRVRAVVSIAGAELPETFGSYGGGSPPVAVLFEQGDHDAYLSVDGLRTMYAATIPPKYLLLLKGTDHNTSLLDVAQLPARLLADEVVAFSDYVAKDGPPDRIDRLATASGFAELTHDG